MPAPAKLKQMARTLGIYPVARSLYRMLSPEVRQQNAADAAIYSSIIKPGDLVFDIGCNLGQKAVTFLRLGARVVALEPNPNCHPVLAREFAGNAKFELIGKAVGATPGEAMLNFANTISTASLRADWHGLAYRDGELQTLAVPVTTLDELVATYGAPVYCKIDVEGFEAEVLRGLSKPLKMVSLEYHRAEPEQILECMEILSRLAPLRINAIAIDGDHFLFDRWISLDEFRAWIAGPDVPRAGDVFIGSELPN